MADDAGDALLTQTYDPYGNLYARAGADVTSYGFTGEQEDSSGLLYLRARYYAPGMGRFFQLDPSRQEMNPYQYSYSNPLNYTDPSGLCADPFADNFDWIPAWLGGTPCQYGPEELEGQCVNCHAPRGAFQNPYAQGVASFYDPEFNNPYFSDPSCSAYWWVSEKYSLWRSLGGCQRCHVTQQLGHIPTNVELDAWQIHVYRSQDRYVQFVHFAPMTLSGTQFILADDLVSYPAYEEARSGGRHTGTYRNYQNRSDNEIMRAMRGYERQVEEHAQKIAYLYLNGIRSIYGASRDC